MGVLIDTSTVGPRERFDYWTAALCNSLHPLALQKHREMPFSGRASAYSLGQLGLGVRRVASDACSLIRTQRDIDDADPESFLVVIQVRGQGYLEQGGRVTTLGVRDITLCDTSQPYKTSANGQFETVQFVVPRRLLGPRADRLRSLTALRIPTTDGPSGLAARFLLDVANGLDAGKLPEADHDIAEGALSLLRTICNEPASALSGNPGDTLSLTLRVQASIERRLGDVDLTPESIARENAISVRYLYRLFEKSGTSVSEWIRGRRLDRIRRDLVDPQLRHLSIHEIASRWGLPSAAHFSRLFRNAYGSSPREFRSSAFAGTARS